MNKLSKLIIILAVFITSIATFASAAEKYDVAAFYWPSLHYDQRWAEFFPDGSQGEWESIRNCKPKWEGHWQPRVPEWGYLMDNDPAAMEKKIDAATSHGVNVMIFDWYWFENKPFLESALNDGFLKAKNVDKMKFYLMWANHDAKTAWDIRRSHKLETIWPGSVDLPTFKTVVARVIKKYFSHPSYYKIDGKPVFSIYDMNNLIKGLGGVKQAAEALDYFRSEVKKAGFPDLHFQMIYWSRVPKIDDSGFASAKGTAANTIKTFKVDSLTNYQFVHLARPEADYVKWADKALSNWPKWSKDFDVPYFPHVSIGWDNNARFVAKRGAVTENVNPQTFKKYLQKAKAYADAHPDQTKLITINAWNEWVEGSYLEPDKRFGMGYLKAVKDVFGPSVATSPKKKPNVLMIAVDDLNDWIGCMGGHPQAKTPNMDRLAKRGVLFTNTQCQSPVCNPSRASLMTSLYPSTSGIYFLKPDLMQSPVAAKSKLMPQRFVDEGYYVTAAGKLFHGRQSAKYIPNYGGLMGGVGPYPKKKISSFPGHVLWDWGVFPERDDQMPDHKIASWAQKQLAVKRDQPLWMGVGFLRPHVPQYAPQKWFDMYPMDTLQLPKIVDNDLSDIPQYGISITRLKHVSPTHEWVTKNKQWKPLVQSYLACVSFVDAQVGRVLDALDKSDCAENTYIVLFTDHGFHIGEKERHAKRSLWEDGTRTPMIIVGPGIAKGKVCNKPTQLLDIYPTLLELTGHKADPTHEGNSLVPLLKNPNADWPHMARTSFGPGNYAIVSEGYRYIRYNDGTEEFYDRDKDPHEWNNIAGSPSMAAEIQKHRKFLPKKTYRIMGKGSTGHKTYEATEAASYNPAD